jgi:hypothetical protein
MVIVLQSFSQCLFAQTSGTINEGIDSAFIFTSPRPLIKDGKTEFINKNIIGFEILLSNSGFGAGGIYERILNNNYKLSAELFFQGVKNTDELEIWWDPGRYDYVVTDKIRRIYAIPLNLGINRYVSLGGLSKSFRPFFGVMAIPTYIWEMPYVSNWFDDVKDSKGHFRFGGGLQIGADFGAANTSLLSVKMRYTYTPFGDGGIESVIGSPIHNMGGFYISLTLGGYY